jgi:hypothetical protein
MTREEATALLGMAKANWPRTEVTLDMVGLWASMLEDMSATEGARALQEHMATSAFWPTVADIRGRATRRELGAQPAELVWAEVMAQVSANGQRRPWVYSSPLVERAVEAIGGPRAICLADESKMDAMKAQLRDAYRAAAGLAEREANVGRLEAHRSARAGQLTAGEALRITEGKR